MSWSEFWSFVTPEWLAFPLVGHYLSADLTWWQWGVIAFDMLLRIVALGYVPSQRKPTSAMAWLLAIFLIPMVGIVLFLLMGSPYINRRRHRIQNQANEIGRAHV